MMDNETRNEELEVQAEPENAENAVTDKKRRTISEAAKAAMAQRRAERKKLADNMVPEVYVQYQDWEGNVAELVEDAKNAFRQEKKRTSITNMKLYIKPEEHAVYYVINEKTGKLEY